MVCAWIMRCRADEEAVLVCHLLAEQAASLFAVRDAELFVLAVHEAVVNAAKAVQRAGMEAGTISLSFFVTSADVAVAVEDEGGGVPADVIEQLDQMTLSDVFFRLLKASHRLAFVAPRCDGRLNNHLLPRPMHGSGSGVVQSPASRASRSKRRNRPVVPLLPPWPPSDETFVRGFLFLWAGSISASANGFSLSNKYFGFRIK